MMAVFLALTASIESKPEDQYVAASPLIYPAGQVLASPYQLATPYQVASPYDVASPYQIASPYQVASPYSAIAAPYPYLGAQPHLTAY
jgi:hypothetical protein